MEPRIQRFFERLFGESESWWRWCFVHAYWLLFSWLVLWTVLSTVLTMTLGGPEATAIPVSMILVGIIRVRSEDSIWQPVMSHPFYALTLVLMLSFPLEHFSGLGAAGVVALRAILMCTAIWKRNQIAKLVFSQKYFDDRRRILSGNRADQSI